MSYTDDPVADYDRHCAEQEKQMAKLPVCDDCGNPINDDFCYDIYGETLCEECLNNRYRKHTDDLIED